jgi:MFS family permease
MKRPTKASQSWFQSATTFPVRIYGVALALRLIPVLFSMNMGIGLDDMFQYDMLARSLVTGNGYRWYAEADLPLIQPLIHLDLTSTAYDPRGVLTSFRAPLYPAFLAIIYFFAGVEAKRFFVARLVQAAAMATLAPLTYSLSRRFYPDRPRTAMISAWIIALYPTLVVYPLALATENLFLILVLCTVLVLLVAAEKSTWQWFALGGALLGLMALTRSISLVIAGLVVLWIWFVLKNRRMTCVVITSVSLVVLPWMIRNTLVFQRLTGIETSLGYNLYVGYHPDGTGTFQYPQSLDLMSMLDDGQRDMIGSQKAVEFIKNNPGRFIYLAARRTGYFFGLERRALTYFYSNNFFGYIPKAGLLSIAALICLPFVVVSTSGVLGLALTHRGRETILIPLFFIGYILPHIFILAEDRFHLAMLPFLAILAAYLWTSGWVKLKEGWATRYGRVLILLAFVGITLGFLNWGLELWRDAGKLALLLGPNGNMTSFSY